MLEDAIGPIAIGVRQHVGEVVPLVLIGVLVAIEFAVCFGLGNPPFEEADGQRRFASDGHTALNKRSQVYGIECIDMLERGLDPG